MPERLISTRICEAVARDFIGDSVVLETARQELGTTYELDFEQGKARYRTEFEGGSITLVDLPISDFVGGVMFSLADQQKITADEACPSNVARISYMLGKIGAENG